MIPGPYAICEYSLPENSDAPILRTIRYGYDTPEDAFKDIPSRAAEEGISAEDLVVIRGVNPEESEALTRFEKSH